VSGQTQASLPGDISTDKQALNPTHPHPLWETPVLKLSTIGFLKLFLTQQTFTVHIYSCFYTKITVDRRASSNPNNVQRIKPQKQCSKNLCNAQIINAQETHTECTKKYTEYTKKVHWKYKEHKCHSDNKNA